MLPVAALVWKIYQLTQRPGDRPLRFVTLCLLCATLSYPLAMPGGASGMDAVAGHGAAKIMQNVLLLFTVYSLMCFYLFSAEAPGARRRARVEAGVALAVAVTITLAAVTVPHEMFAGSFATADMAVPQIATFYAGAGLYLMYALGTAAWWTRRYAGMSRRPHSTGLWVTATGLWVTATGLGLMAVACAVRAVFVGVRWAGGTVPHPVMTSVAKLLVVSILLFVAGITYSGARARVASLRIWLRHRRAYRRLAPLWELLATAYPENVLRPASQALFDRWRARGVHRRYHRRMVECRDGLVDISPYLVGEDEDPAVLGGAGAADLAARLRRASVRIGGGVPAPRRAVPVAIGLGPDRHADVSELIAVSDALRNTEETS